MEHRELTDHGEPDAAPGDRRAAVALEPPEAIPPVLPVRAAPARPGVVHPRPRRAAPPRPAPPAPPAPPVVERRADADLLTRGAILHRVVEQVEQHLPHRARIGRDDEIL